MFKRTRALSVTLTLLMLLNLFSLALAEPPCPDMADEPVSEAFEPYIEEITDLSLGDGEDLFYEEDLEAPCDAAAVFEASDAFSGYALMNIPFGKFFAVVGADMADVDAVTTATFKVGSYGIAGGAYHTTRSYDGTQPVKTDDSTLKGVIWPVKAETLDEIIGMGGIEITDESAVTVATSAHGNASTTDLASYACLMEAPSYSYYLLDEAPANYLTLADGRFSAGSENPESMGVTAPTSLGTIYSGHHADIEMGISAYPNGDKYLVNAAVLTTEDGGRIAMSPLYQVWRGGMQLGGVSIGGKRLTGIRFYCSPKAEGGKATAGYANCVLDYAMDAAIPVKYDGALTGAFTGPASMKIGGLTDAVVNPRATVYYSAGKGSTPVYLAQDAAVDHGAVALTAAPEIDKTYTVQLSADNYGFKPFSVAYAPETIEISKNTTVAVSLGTVYRVTVKDRSLSGCVSKSGKIVSATDDGTIAPLKAGTGKVAVSYIKSNGRKKTLTLTLKVQDPAIPTKIRFEEGAKRTVTVGEQFSLTPVIEPATADQTVTWTSSNDKVATVENGVVKAIKKGSATITAKTANGKKAAYRVTVKKAK